MDENLKKQILIDNYENPFHKGLNNKCEVVDVYNSTCADKFKIEIELENNIIKDMYFDGDGCAISTSATSIMLKLFVGKTIKEALNIIYNYEKMINESEYDIDVLEEAIVFENIYKEPARKKCALISYEKIKEYLENKLEEL